VNGLTKVGALVGAFVCQCKVERSGFEAVDGTKDLAHLGILPDRLFFVGTSKTISVGCAGTLFLGINDSEADDNSGGFNVTVTEP